MFVQNASITSGQDSTRRSAPLKNVLLDLGPVRRVDDDPRQTAEDDDRADERDQRDRRRQAAHVVDERRGPARTAEGPPVSPAGLRAVIAAVARPAATA